MYDLNDPKSKGHGFPTKSVCEHEMAKGSSSVTLTEGTCVKGVCDVSDKEAVCACSEYKNVAQFHDPCKFLEANCDENSIAYTEAKLKMEQANVAVEDIVTIEDAERFLRDLDNLANKLP